MFRICRTGRNFVPFLQASSWDDNCRFARIGLAYWEQHYRTSQDCACHQNLLQAGERPDEDCVREKKRLGRLNMSQSPASSVHIPLGKSTVPDPTVWLV